MVALVDTQHSDALHSFRSSMGVANGLTMSETPLSDRITVMALDASASARDAFHDLFLVSHLGVIASGVPAAARPGIPYQVVQGDAVTMRVVVTPDGHRTAKACADPAVFVLRFDGEVNAGILGRHLLEMVLKTQDVAGVLVSRASSFNSIPIYRKDIPQLLSQQTARVWWRWW